MLDNLTQRQLELLAEALELFTYDLRDRRLDAWHDGFEDEAETWRRDLELVQDLLDAVNSNL